MDLEKNVNRPPFSINTYIMENCKNCDHEAHCPEVCFKCNCKKCDCSVCKKPRPKVKTGDEIVQ